MKIFDFLFGNIDYSKKSLRNFNLVFGVFFLVIAIIAYLKSNDKYLGLLIASAAFFLIAFVFPKLTVPLYVVWMAFANILNFFMMRLIFSIMFYLMITPMALIIRLFRKHFFPMNFDRSKETYWIDKDEEEYNPKHFEKQFS